jgi:hypothetical protein
MDAAVRDQPLERDARDFAADRVEAGKHHGLRRVVDDQVDAGRGFERADVPALTADNAALHFVVRQRHHRYGMLGHMVRRATLYRLGKDLFGALLGILDEFVLELFQAQGGVAADFVLEVSDEFLLGFVRRQAGDGFEFFAFFED